MKVRLCSFGSDSFAGSIRLFETEAQQSSYFDSIKVYREADLPHLTMMEARDYAFIHTNKCGFGYWLWKWFIILEEMFWAEPGDLIIYADVGCSIESNPGARKTFQELIHRVMTEAPYRFFYTIRYLEREWCKRDLFEGLGLALTSPEMHGNQRTACIQLYLNNSDNRNFLVDLVNIARQHDYRWIDDRPSLAGRECPEFKEHRHDQSILSLWSKIHGAHTELESLNRAKMPIFPAKRRIA